MKKKAGIQYDKKSKKWIARVTFIRDGKRHDRKVRADSYADATAKLEALQSESKKETAPAKRHRFTFADLAKYYRETYLVPAVYVGDRKVEGMRGKSLGTVRGQLQMWEEYFTVHGPSRLAAFTFETLRTARRNRLNTATRSGGARSIATVNRELTLLNRMFSIAQRKRWIDVNPFACGEDRLISLADEQKRKRVLSQEEEARLIACAARTTASPLVEIIIMALDTGMRQGEIFTLTWADVDFARGLIHVKAFNTKTLQSRSVSMSKRLDDALRTLAEGKREPDDRVFGITSNVKSSFTRARTAAGLPDVRFHDLRHSHATRLVQGGLSLAEVGNLLGHTQPKTTYRYVNNDGKTLGRQAEIMNILAAGQESGAEGNHAPVN